jgi:uncharacterized protein (TIGR02118 family)
VITRFGFAPRLPGLTHAEFQRHWRERHAPIIRVLPGLARYWQNHAVASGLPWPGFDACSEMDATDVAAFDALFAEPHYLTEGRADERRFIDRTRGGTFFAYRIGPVAALPAAGIRLLTFFSAAADLDTLAAVLATPGRGAGAGAVEAFVRLPEVAGAFDGVEALWFADAATARQHLTSDSAERDRCALAGLARGTERVLATVHVVR